MNTRFSFLLLPAAALVGGVPAQSGVMADELRRLERLVDEHGCIDPSARALALQERSANLAAVESLDGGGIGRWGWTERSPSNLGGAAVAIAVHPTATDRIFVGSPGGGFWRSQDGGLSWAVLDERMDLNITCLALDPNDADTIYAGTGAALVGRTVVGGGVWRSRDGGDSWRILQSTSGWPVVRSIAVPWTNSSVLVVATDEGIRRSTDTGNSWTTVRSGRATQVVVDPSDGTRMLAHVDVGAAPFTDHRVYRSTNTGLSWLAASGLPTGDRIALHWAGLPGTVWASAGGGQCWRSTNGGSTWTQRTTSPIVEASDWGRRNAIWVDPTNASIVVIGSTNLWRSQNGGQTFAQISAGGIDTTQPHPGIHAVAAPPSFNGTTSRGLWVATLGGIWRTGDIYSASTTGNWLRRDAGFRTMQYESAAGTANGRYVAGARDTATHVIAPGTTVASVRLATDGGHVAIDPTDSNFVYASESQLRIFRSTNGGTTFAPIVSGLNDVGTCADAVAPFVLAPSDPNVMFAGGCSVWRCVNVKSAAPTWTQIRVANGSRVRAIAVAPTNANVVWVGYADGTIVRTNLALTSPSWTIIDDNTGSDPLPDRAVTRILVDRTSSLRVLVAFGGYASDNLWRSTSGGSSWVDVSGSGVASLPSAPIYGLAQHPTFDGRYYAATEVGMFGTSDSFVTWSTSNDGPTSASCEEVSFANGGATLLVATYGRGLWTASIFEPEVQTLGPGCAGTAGVPVLAVGPPRIGTSIPLDASGLRPSALLWLLLGTSSTSWFGNPLPFDLLPFGAGGCVLRVRPDSVRDAVASAGGTWSSVLPVAPIPALLGTSWFVQMFVSDPLANSFGLVGSNGLRLVLGN